MGWVKLAHWRARLKVGEGSNRIEQHELVLQFGEVFAVGMAQQSIVAQRLHDPSVVHARACKGHLEHLDHLPVGARVELLVAGRELRAGCVLQAVDREVFWRCDEVKERERMELSFASPSLPSTLPLAPWLSLIHL